MKVYIDGRRNGYSPKQCGSTFTVEELIAWLEDNYDPEDEIYIINDRGYTYGNIDESSFSTEEDYEREEYEDD